MNVTVEGFEELHRRLEKLEDVGKKPILAKALKIRADMVRDAARSRAPRRTGALARDIMRGPTFGASLFEAVIQVGTHSEDHGFYQEFGTGGSFQAAAARALGYPGQGSRSSHNMPAQPFLIPAVRATEASSISAVERELQSEIHKAENA